MKNKKILSIILSSVYCILIILVFIYKLYALYCLFFSIANFSLFIVKFIEARKHRHIPERKLYVILIIDSIYCLVLSVFFVGFSMLIYYNPFSKLIAYSKKDDIKLDEILKMLFNVSNALVVKILNYFFSENFDGNKNYNIEFTSTESTDLNLELRRADIFIKVENVPGFHFEFQISKENMILGMLEYGYREALKYVNEEEKIKTIYFPKQAVLYLEERKNVPEELKMRIVFPITDKGEQKFI